MDSHQLLLPLGFRMTLECSAANPGDKNHHLRRKRSGLFQLRFTVDRGPKFVGERVVISLRTRDAEEAQQRRDTVMDALTKAKIINGFIIANVEIRTGTTEAD